MEQGAASTGRKERYREIDGLRGIAATMVLLFHYTHQFRERWGHPYPARYDLDIGYLGVHLFFVISGFVIYMTVLRSRNAWDFARKRILRLYPAYWICMTITFIVLRYMAPSLGEEPPTWRELGVGATMVSKAFGVRWIDGAYWSLFIELGFYVIIAVCLLSPLRRYARWFAVLWFGAMVMHHLWRPVSGISSALVLHHGPLFLAGILFYRLRTASQRNAATHALIAGCFALALFQFAGNWREGLFISAVFAFFWYYAYRDVPLLGNRAVLFLGWISYPLYLIHQEVGNAIIMACRTNGVPAPLAIALAAAVAIGVATLIARYVEPAVKGLLAAALGRS